jgi:predicted HicB family RNase H-like nuclease
MAITMTYKGYIGKVELDEDENMLSGTVLTTRDVITFMGRSVKEVRKALKDSIEDYLAYCAEHGETPDKPYNGKILVRVEPALHAKLVAGAALRDESLNELVSGALEKYAAEMPELQEA